jgi:hypothetical protein
MSSSVFHLTPTLSDNPRLHLRDWKLSINRYARTLLAQHDPYGLLSAVADPIVWQALPANINIDAAGNPDYRALPTYPAPPPLLLATAQPHVTYLNLPPKPVQHTLQPQPPSPLFY